MGCLSGKFTTIEGILKDLRTDLIEKNPFASGDSAVHEGRLVSKLLYFIYNITSIKIK